MSRLAQIIGNHIKKAQKEPNEHLIFSVNDSNMKHVYLLIRNLDTDETPEWKDGVFLAKLILPDNFPTDPPKFMLLNENGVYAINTEAICISIGHYHKEDGWRPVLGLAGFAREVANGMMHRQFLIEKGGLNLLDESPQQIAKHSKASYTTLMSKYPEIMNKLTSEFESYSKNWDLSKVDERTKKRLAFGSATFINELAANSDSTASTSNSNTSTNGTDSASETKKEETKEAPAV